MNAIRPSIPRLSALLRKKPLPMPSLGPPLPPGILVDEEISPVYDSKYFYPAKPGEALAGHYQTLVKVGWGVSSTVWLARDLQGQPSIISVQFETLSVSNKHTGISKIQRASWH